MVDQFGDEGPVVLGSAMTPAGQRREDDLFDRGVLPWFEEESPLASAPLLRAVEPGALDRSAGEQGGSAVDAGPREKLI